jgi:apolipoprotein D and lipocalin family protein
MRYFVIGFLVVNSFILGACSPLDPRPSGNTNVPQPAKPVELSRYLGKWYENNPLQHERPSRSTLLGLMG